MVAAGVVEGGDVIMNEEACFGMSSADGAQGFSLDEGPKPSGTRQQAAGCPSDGGSLFPPS